MSKVLKAIGGLLVLAIAVAVSGGIYLATLDFNDLRAMVERQIEAATGRQVEISGDLDLKLSLRPQLSIKGVSFSNAAWGTNPEMAQLGELTAEVELLALLQNQVQVNSLVVRDLDLYLETDGKGQANWEFGSAQPPSNSSSQALAQSFTPSIAMMDVENVTITYFDGLTKRKATLEAKAMQVTSDGMDAPLLVVLDGAYNGQPIRANATLGSFAHLIGSGGGAFPVSIEAAGLGATFTAEGGINQPADGFGFQLGVMTRITDPSAIGRAIAVDLSGFPAATLSGDLKSAAGTFTLDNMVLRSQRSDMRGKVSVRLDRAVPQVKASLQAGTLDLGPFLKLEGEDRDPTDPDRIFQPDPLPFDALKAADVTLDFSAKRLLTPNIDLDTVKAQLTMSKGVLNLKTLSAKVGGGTMTASGRVDGSLSKPSLRIKAKAKGLDAALFNLHDFVELTIDADVDVRGKGKSVADIMAGLDGRSRIIGRNGQIKEEAFAAAGQQALADLPWLSSAESRVINCVVSSFDIRGGNAEVEALLFDTNGFTVSGEGSVNLASEGLHLTVVPQAKTAILKTLAVPVDISGTFKKPEYDARVAEGALGAVGGLLTSPGTALVDLLKIDDAAGADDSCVAALNQSGKRPTSVRAPTTSSTTTRSPNAPPPLPSESTPTKPSDLKGQIIEQVVPGLLENLFKK